MNLFPRRIALGIVLALFCTLGLARAQDRSLVWERWDVDISNVQTADNRFDVRESYRVRFDGAFRFGSAVIPDDRLEAISNFSISVDGALLSAQCNQRPATFCVTRDDNNDYSIVYYFPQPVIDQIVEIIIAYTVDGALRIYEGGDQLWWDAIPEEHFGFPIRESTVTVTLPREFAPREGVDPVVTYGASGDVRVNGGTVVATATNGVAGDEGFSVRVQYPHDARAVAPAWQAAFDARREFEENVQPLYNIGLPFVSLLICGVGAFWIYLQYQNRGRDPEVGLVPEYLAEPPSDLSAALVGTLVDERADVKDVIALILDLARQGYIVIEETRQAGFLGMETTKFFFKRTDKALQGLRGFEKLLLDRLFAGQEERSLDSLRNRFYAYIPAVQNALYDGVVEEGLFDRSPAATRGAWSTGGVLLIVLGVFGLFLGVAAVESVSPFVLCFPASIAFVGLIAASVGSFMPAKTQKGAQEAAKWRAFRTYMRQLERYGSVEEAAARFGDFIPYATAFGLSSVWLSRFREATTAQIPPWYYPTYLGGPYRRGYTPGTPLFPGSVGQTGNGLPGELARAGDGGFTPDALSRGLAGSMNSLANGLETMINSASRVITSRPQSASGSGRWGSGGGSFSGGGFSGGGGSGGGSRGFG